MKNPYVEPDMEFIAFDTQNIIVNSGSSGWDPDNGEEP